MSLPITLTIALNFPEKQESGVKSPIKHFNSWNELYTFIRHNGFNKNHTMVISNLVLSKRPPKQVLKVSKDKGYWIVEMYPR